MKYVISGPNHVVKNIIRIPSSKSISNRMLILKALASSDFPLENLSSSDDTRLLQEALASTGSPRDVGHAGTAMRFLTAYFSVRPEGLVLTGSERMKQRPLGPLVEALRVLGADIAYLETEGCPPVMIRSGITRGGTVEVDGGISSQFISALMMIGPLLPGGLHIRLLGEVVSHTYMEMTAALMREGGINVSIRENEILIPQGSYRFKEYVVESDWSGASYWYQVAALLPGSEISLPYLSPSSLQGDSVLTELFIKLGVESEFTGQGLIVHSGSAVSRGEFRADCTGFPDLVQTLATTLCALDIPFHLTGTRTLRVKETDRIAALHEELGKLGFVLQSDQRGDWLGWKGEKKKPEEAPVIETYHDHRMALAFAPLSCTFGKISIADPMVVSKSYPSFWADLEEAGFSLSVSS